MTRALTLLFLNAGRRVELIRGFRRAFELLGLDGRIVTTDVNGLAPALYLGDTHCWLPYSHDPAFLGQFLDLCQRENVGLIIPLIDPDLPVLAGNVEAIESTGAQVLVSPERVIDICRNKKKTYGFLKKNGFPTPQIFGEEQAGKHGFPLIIKPLDGSASVNVFKINDSDELKFFARYVPNAVIQEFINGDEFTTDVFSDWSGNPIAAVPRRRLKVRAGEVSVGRVERNPELEQICKEVAKWLGTVGPINIQAIQSGDSWQILEINPRFGGGSPLSMAAGMPMDQWAISMALNGSFPAEPPVISDHLTMMRFDDSFFYSPEELAQ